jgi:hypothetical protein
MKQSSTNKDGIFFVPNLMERENMKEVVAVLAASSVASGTCQTPALCKYHFIQQKMHH